MEREKGEAHVEVTDAARFGAIRRVDAWWSETVSKLEKALSAGEITDNEFERTKQQAAYLYLERLKQYDQH